MQPFWMLSAFSHLMVKTSRSINFDIDGGLLFSFLSVCENTVFGSFKNHDFMELKSLTQSVSLSCQCLDQTICGDAIDTSVL